MTPVGLLSLSEDVVTTADATTYPQHDRQLTELSNGFLPLTAIHTAFEATSQAPTIGDMTFSAFSRKYLSLLINLVRGRQHAPLQEDLADSDFEFVSSRIWIDLEWIPIEECFDSNVS